MKATKVYPIINSPNRVVAAGLGFVSGGEIGVGEVGAAALVVVSLGAVPFVL